MANQIPETVSSKVRYLKVNYGGRWQHPSRNSGGFNKTDFVDGQVMLFPGIVRDVVNTFDLFKRMEEKDSRLKGCDYSLSWLHEGARHIINTNDDFLHMWSTCNENMFGYINLFAEVHASESSFIPSQHSQTDPMGTVRTTFPNMYIKKEDEHARSEAIYHTSEKTAITYEVLEIISSDEETEVDDVILKNIVTPKGKGKSTDKRNGKKTIQLEGDFVAHSPLPSGSDDDLPEEILDDIPQVSKQKDGVAMQGTKSTEILRSQHHPPFETERQENGFEPERRDDRVETEGANHQSEVTLHIDELEPEEDYHSDGSSDDEPPIPPEDIEGFGDDVDELYDEVDFGEEEYNETHIVKLEVGKEWPTMTGCRNSLRNYAIKNRFVIDYEKNEADRLLGHCSKAGCKWEVRIRKIAKCFTVRLNKFVSEHTCVRKCDEKNRMANAPWIASIIEEEIRVHQKVYTPKSIGKEIWRKFSVRVSYWSCWAAKQKVIAKIFGSFEDGFRRSHEICSQVLASNPRSIAVVSCDQLDKTFEGMCIAFNASLTGFISGCRPLIGLDGCFLKGKYNGVCLSATALDANNGLFPLAIYICKNECFSTWDKFLGIIKDHLLLHPNKLSLMSDRQKGLIDAVAKHFPEHHHRFCFRHYYKNFKLRFKGDHLRHLSWGAARAYKQSDFDKWRAQLQKDAPDALEWLMKENVTTWARSHLDHSSKCEHITNNFSESFNNWIRDLRDKPLVSFIDGFHMMVMKLIYDRKLKARKWIDGDLVPRAKKIIEKLKKQVNKYDYYGSDDGLYCVRSTWHSENTWTVNLNAKTCTCCVWDITGIPCAHAVVILAPYNPNWSQHCSPFHSVEAYRRTYSEAVIPLADIKDWNEPTITVLPPRLLRAPGRPKTSRTREEDEQYPRAKKQKRCGTCGILGHNERTCKGGEVGSNNKGKASSTSTSNVTKSKTTSTSSSMSKSKKTTASASKSKKTVPAAASPSQRRGFPSDIAPPEPNANSTTTSPSQRRGFPFNASPPAPNTDPTTTPQRWSSTASAFPLLANGMSFVASQSSTTMPPFRPSVRPLQLPRVGCIPPYIRPPAIPPQQVFRPQWRVHGIAPFRPAGGGRGNNTTINNIGAQKQQKRTT